MTSLMMVFLRKQVLLRHSAKLALNVTATAEELLHPLWCHSAASSRRGHATLESLFFLALFQFIWSSINLAKICEKCWSFTAVALRTMYDQYVAKMAIEVRGTTESALHEATYKLGFFICLWGYLNEAATNFDKFKFICFTASAFFIHLIFFIK